MRLTDPQLLRRKVQSAEHGRGFVQAQPAAHRIAHRFGLLEDFLEHVVRIAVELHVVGHDVQHAHVVGDVPLIAIDHVQRVGRDDGQLVVGQVDDLGRCGRPAAKRRWRRNARHCPRRPPSGLPSRAAMSTSG